MPKTMGFPSFNPDEPKTYIRVKGQRGTHEFINVYIAKSGRKLVDYREAKTMRTRSVPADEVRRLCERCTQKVETLRRPATRCADCEELRF